MQRVVAVVFFLIVLFTLTIMAEESEGVESTVLRNWVIPIQDGKTEHLTIAESERFSDLKDYYEYLMGITYWNVKGYTKAAAAAMKSAYSAEKLKMTPIGSWGSYEVFDLTQSEIKHKAILLRDTLGDYRVLYLQF